MLEILEAAEPGERLKIERCKTKIKIYCSFLEKRARFELDVDAPPSLCFRGVLMRSGLTKSTASVGNADAEMQI